ncbi:shikimate kinase [bacterium]|jgi:shikimate kinase|nr:shikimate kinase [bacterium]
MKNRILVLIGMAGVGKSTIGKQIAKHLGRPFIDLDRVIEDREGAPLQSLIDTKGEDYFIELEGEVLEELINDLDSEHVSAVVSPGGSIVYAEEAIAAVKTKVLFIYLEDKLESIKKRIPNLENRGIVGLNGRTLDEVFNERVVLYESTAHRTYSLTGKAMAAIAQQIAKEST